MFKVGAYYYGWQSRIFTQNLIIIRDWYSTGAPPFFNFTIFLASRESEDDFPRNDDEEGDEDSFDDETR